jgi:tellurite resistance protein TehA-like permease
LQTVGLTQPTIYRLDPWSGYPFNTIYSSEIQFFEHLLPFTIGVSLFFWSTAAWWLPLLFVLQTWRWVIRRAGIRYEPGYWGMAFPLGMYTACTYQLAKSLDLGFLAVIPRYFIYIALAAWLLTFTGLLKMLFQSFKTN